MKSGTEQRRVRIGPQPTVVTFYSYKGGVGRTWLLANTALHLTRRGHSVFLLDFDLEAPGLSNYFGVRSTRIASGHFDLLRRHYEGEEPLADGSLHPLVIEGSEMSTLPEGDDAAAIRSKPYGAELAVCRLNLLPAGSLGLDLARGLAGVHWNEYVRSGRLVDYLADLLAAITEQFRPDFVLVDSRTGLAAYAGFLAGIFPEASVLVTNLTDQSMEGTRLVLDRLRGQGNPPLAVVASMIPPLEEARKRLEELAEDLGDREPYRLDYHPQLGLREKLLGAVEVPEIAPVIETLVEDHLLPLRSAGRAAAEPSELPPEVQVPDPPPALAAAVREGRADLLVGWELSSLAGMSSLDEIVADLAQELFPDLEGASAQELLDLCETELGEGPFRRKVRQRMHREGPRPGAAHRELLELPWGRVFTTTLDRLVEETVRSMDAARCHVYRNDDALLDGEEPGVLPIYHLNGHIEDGTSWVLHPHRQALFDRDRPRMADRLFRSLRDRSMVLIGFDPDDQHLLVLTERARRSSWNHPHFLIVFDWPEVRARMWERREFRICNLKGTGKDRDRRLGALRHFLASLVSGEEEVTEIRTEGKGTPAGDAAEPAEECAEPSPAVGQPEAERSDLAVGWESYLNHLRSICARAELGGIRSAQGVELDLEKVYIPLHASSLGEEDLQSRVDSARKQDPGIDEWARSFLRGGEEAVTAEDVDRACRLTGVPRPVAGARLRDRSRNDLGEGMGQREGGGMTDELAYASKRDESRDDPDEDGLLTVARQLRRFLLARLPLEEVLAAWPAALLVGPPGCGKTTHLRMTAFQLAGRVAEGVREGRSDGEPGESRVPILVRLPAYTRWLGERDASLPSLLDYVVQDAAGEGVRLPAADLVEHLWREGGVALLADGLDEVPRARRQTILDLMDKLSREASGNGSRLLVTSRTRAFERTEGFRSGPVLEIQPLSEEEIRRFLGLWYGALLRSEGARRARRRADEVYGGIQRKPDVRRAAVNPLVLTALAVVETTRQNLPESATELYEEVLGVLLHRWEKAHHREVIAREEFGDTFREGEMFHLAEAIAWPVQEEGRLEADRREVDREAAVEWIADALPGIGRVRDPALAEQVLAGMELRTGVVRLGERPSGDEDHWIPTIHFSHLQFQEYLAARHLEKVCRSKADFEQRIGAGRRDDDNWAEVLVFLAGILGMKTSGLSGEFLEFLLEGMPRGIEEKAARYKLYIGCLREMKTVPGSPSERLAPVLERFRDRTWADRPHLLIQVGRALGDAGDPRLEGGPGGHGPMIEIPGGEFPMGSEDPDAYKDEGPVHRVELDPFRIDRFPVTNAQFRRFIEAGGYHDRSHWSDEGWAVRQKEGWEEPRYWRDPRWNGPNHPVVGVSWFEAAAYAEFAGRRLPTEAEWERAARGPAGERGPFPWGVAEGEDDWQHRMNAAQVYEGTTPVGCFPLGTWKEVWVGEGERVPMEAVPMDMAGNVWEWCADRYSEDYYRACKEQGVCRNPEGPDRGKWRILRGGSWNLQPRNCRVSYRDRLHPSYRYNDVGFRCAQ